MLDEFIHFTRRVVKNLLWNWTIYCNIWTTTLPLCHLATLVFFIIYILCVPYLSHEWENDITKRIRGLLYVTALNLYISNYGYLFGTATYVDYLMFSHLNPITNPTPLPNATLTIGATACTLTIGAAVCTLTIGAAARNPNYRGCCTQP
jgi:hypothetical protein